MFGLCAALAACGSAPDPTGGRPDVLLVVVDTLRADRTGVLERGPSLTPELDALGAEGTVFRTAIAPSSWTLPSIAALFAGRDVSVSRKAAFADGPSLAERFAEAGYRTVGVVANPLLTADAGYARGFEGWTVAPAESTADLAADLSALRAWDAEALVARAAAEVRATDARPLFLYLHLMDPHVPYDPANERLAPRVPGWSADTDGRGPPDVAWAARLLAPLPLAQREHLGSWRHAYDGQVAFVDRALGRLRRVHAASGRGPAIVAVTSDHGEGLFSHALNPDSGPAADGELAGGLAHGYADHGEQLYEEAIRVPLWLAGPGVPARRVEERPLPVRALGSTLLGLVGARTDLEALPLADERPVPAATFGTGTRGWFVRTDRFKLLVPFEERLPHPDVGPRLFEVDAIGGGFAPEDVDVADAHPEVAAELERAFAAWRERHADDPGADVADPATLERLRALGYVR